MHFKFFCILLDKLIYLLFSEMQLGQNFRKKK